MLDRRDSAYREEQLELFLKGGGTITNIPAGVTGEKVSKTFTEQKKKVASRTWKLREAKQQTSLNFE